MRANPFKAPGDDPFWNTKRVDPTARDSTSNKPDSSLIYSRGGGAARKVLEDRQQASRDSEPYDYPEAEREPAEEKPKEDPAVLSNPQWVESDTLFHQEAEVSIQVTVPQGKEHITKVEAELFVKKPSGPESLSKGEGHFQKDGRAVISLPVYKPKGYLDGVEELFVRFTHKLAKILDAEEMLRKVSETALKSVDHILVPGIAFERDTSFINPKASAGLKQLESKLQEWEKKYPKKAQVVVFGHADKNEKDVKGLSERRAQSAYAFIAHDAAAWEKLYGQEKWGLRPLQTLLKDLNHYHGAVDGQDGPDTQSAFKAFQEKSGLPESGRGDAGTRKALFAAYMKGKHGIRIEPSRFSKVAGNPWMGCASNNLARNGDEAAPENRRVTFILVNPSKYFPVHFPCQDGSEAPCREQCKKAGKRSGAGVKCLFYDELVREGEQETAAVKGENVSSNEPAWMPIARKEIGVTEIREANKDNPRIIEYHQTTSLKAHDDETPWCASFANWCLEKSGFKGEGSALAKTWLNWGRAVDEPIYGALACIYFPDLGTYHVGFVDGIKGKYVLLLGGNQSHAWKVSISRFEKAIVKGYRLPSEYKGPENLAIEKSGEYGSDNATGTR